MNPNLVIGPRATLREALEAITKNVRQAVVVTEADGRLAGLVTDGDVRRALLRGIPLDGTVAEIMNLAPGWRWVRDASGARKEYVPLLENPWPDWPGLRDAKLKEKRCHARSSAD